MTQLWQPGTQYNLGDEVVYEGVRYRIIQAHRSQGDWTPPVTPALWGRMQEGSGGSHGQGGQGHCPPPAQPQQPQHAPQAPIQPPPNYGDHKQDQGHQGQGQGGHHSDSDDDGNKNKLIAGGLAAGAALLGGGLFAYKHHKDKKEDQAAYATWVRNAQADGERFWRDGPKGPATWVFNHGNNIPNGAISTGHNLFICRAWMDGGILLGKASGNFSKGGLIGYKKEEHEVDQYEILLGNMNELKWVRTSGKLDVNRLGARPIPGGNENDGTPLYVAKAHHEGVEYPAKSSEKLKGAYVSYKGKEIAVNDYDVLCYK